MLSNSWTHEAIARLEGISTRCQRLQGDDDYDDDDDDEGKSVVSQD